MLHVMNMDCLEGMAGLEDRVIKAVVTSPPYNLGLDYGSESNDLKPWEDYAAWMTSVWTEVRRVLQDDGHFFLQVGGTAKQPLLPMNILATALKAGFLVQNQILWVKSIHTKGRTHGHFKPLNSKRFLNHTFEYIFHLTKDGNQPIDRLSIGVPYEDQSNVGRFDGAAGGVRCRGNSWFIPYDTIQSTNKDRGGHPATFPVALPEMCLRLAGVQPHDVVLDPFLGIGTTLVAASNLCVGGVGFEVNPQFAATAGERLGVQVLK